ncbi:peptidoglycan-binding protein [Streptomonospora nanhaiensis]|uniref:Murein L,D-transpeptidase YcbB/YkuD n=1 Tax=Streptomonospora nanhaiensis TaxID=1323731 RepID=A0A853BS49_9ACTN|nr:peptidoglycan-binding domain-containing protein [Streptomonospora nanhaiensis]MBV2366041.1 peptidoglycan-binding protein [Streptomonospora nanhaiensis]MBX9390453.1 peptidoglycan-binding protein [Streptomonospora nanhaiensis]NYI97704.1 murein L,D-transpeptidase YcbB/YkuD [Streptomonospora nanhaiensis]
MTTKRRAAAVAAATGIALALGGLSAPAALADGPRTPPAVAEAVQARPWVVLSEGDREYRVLAVAAILAEERFYHKEPIATFDADLVAAVEEYQAARGLPVTGVVDGAVWEALSDDVGLVRAGDSRPALVNGLEHSLTHLGYSPLDHGGFTRAVKAFQRDRRIGVDGVIGPITFRAMYAEGAEDPV